MPSFGMALRGSALNHGNVFIKGVKILGEYGRMKAVARFRAFNQRFGVNLLCRKAPRTLAILFG